MSQTLDYLLGGWPGCNLFAYYTCFLLFFLFISKSFFFSENYFKNAITISEKQFVNQCKTVWIQIRPDILFGLIWLQFVCKGYQQMTPVIRLK